MERMAYWIIQGRQDLLIHTLHDSSQVNQDCGLDLVAIEVGPEPWRHGGGMAEVTHSPVTLGDSLTER